MVAQKTLTLLVLVRIQLSQPYPVVAKFGKALELGSRNCTFESCLPDH